MFEQRLILDRYRIIGRAGAGGYATVQHAYDTRLKRDVAIKCIELSQTDIAKARVSVVDGLLASQRESILDQVLAGESGDSIDLTPLPNEPGFLNMRDAMAAKRTGRGNSRSGYSDGSIYSRYNRASRYNPKSSKFSPKGNSYSANTADITKLAGELPVISGAGQANISSIDDVVDVSDVYIESSDSHDAYDDAFANPQHTISLIGAPRARMRANNAGRGGDTQAFLSDASGRRGGRGDKGISANDLEMLQAAISPLENSFDNIPGLEEARTAAHLNDANIVTVYDCVVEGAMAYVIMEYVEGKTLARMMRELDNSITLDMVTSVFIAVAHALQVAHKAGVLHLDIKPENVIINRDGVVKVADFGLSTLMDASGRGTTGGGTIGYMPLEQMRQLPLDVRTDEWALASLTYEMLSGVNPYRAKTLEGAEVAILDAIVEPPSHFWDIDPDIDSVMFRALAPDMEDRFGNIHEFADDLTPFLGDAKAGQKQLSSIVIHGVADADRPEPSGVGALGLFSLFQRGSDADDDEGSRESALPEREHRQSVPLIDRLGERGRSIVMRIFAALSAVMIGVISLMNYRFEFAVGAEGGNAAQDGAEQDGDGWSDSVTGSQDSAQDGSQSPDGGGDIGQSWSASDAGSAEGFDPGEATAVGIPDISEAGSNAVSSVGDSFTSAYTTTYGDESLYGLFSLAPIVAWILLAGFAVAAFIKPKVGMPIAYGALFVMLLLNQAWGSAFLLLAATGAWWWFFGRHSDAGCTVVMLQPLFGSIGFAAIAPVMAGALLDLKDAVAASAMAAVGAIVFASLGSCDVMNWEIYSNFIVAINPVIAGASIMQGLGETFASLQTWCVVITWIGAAALYSLFCWKGSRTFDILGSVVCGILIILGAFFVPVVIGQNEPMSALRIAGAIIPALIGVLFAVMNIPDRVRIEA